MSTRPQDIAISFFTALEAQDNATLDRVVADDVRFRFGNNEPTDSKAAFVASTTGLQSAVSSMKHELLNVWEVEAGTVVLTANVQYTRLDGREVSLPACSVVVVREDQIHEGTIYVDMSPVFAP